MKVSEVIETLQKCNPNDDIVVDLDGDFVDITFLWEDPQIGVVICLDDMPNSDDSINEESEYNPDTEEICNQHNPVAEI